MGTLWETLPDNFYKSLVLGLRMNSYPFIHTQECSSQEQSLLKKEGYCAAQGICGLIHVIWPELSHILQRSFTSNKGDIFVSICWSPVSLNVFKTQAEFHLRGSLKPQQDLLHRGLSRHILKTTAVD